MARRTPPGTGKVPVVFRFQPPSPCPFVDLRGEMSHFQQINPMTQRGSGEVEQTLFLETGVFGYKFYGGGQNWWLDPFNPRTRCRDGARNNILVIGGTDEPVFHAPARPFVFVQDSGSVCVRAGLRKGAFDSLSIRWDEGEGHRQTPLHVVASEDEHLLLEAYLPISAQKFHYAFVLPNGQLVGRQGGAGQMFSVERKDITPATPDWWRTAVVYTILLDRFRRNEAGTWGLPPDHPQGRWGGHLKGVTAALPYLRDLGVNVLHLSPVALSPSLSSHRYDAVDPQVVDPDLGGEEGLQALLEQAHALGLHILLDVAITHTDRDFAPFVDVRQRGYASRYAGWFTLHRFPFGDGINPGYEHYQKGQWREPLLRTDNPEVIDYWGETFARWARLGVDGFRVDAAADVPISTLRQIASAARAARPDLVLFGEVVPPNIHRYTADAFDSATDFTALETLLQWLHKKTISAEKVAEILSQRRFDRGGPAWSAIQFTTTHDHHRFLSVTGDARLAQLAQLFVLLAAPVPMLLYGDEVGLTGGPAFAEMEGAWSDRLPMPWPPAGQSTAPEWSVQTLEMVKKALHLRRNTPALAVGDDVYFSLPVQGDSHPSNVLIMRRTHGDQMVDVLMNGSSTDADVPFPAGGPTGANLLFQLGQVEVFPHTQTVRMGPYSAAVLERVPSPSSLETVHTLVNNGPAIVSAAFRNGYTESAPYPTHLYLTVTERCNIQCEHCITFAPEKTADGRARTIEPWLLNALHEPFSALEYAAFVHGGESLVAPIFWDVLKALTSSRSRRPGKADIHLLSNGMLLNETRVRKLIDHGLTSLSVSIDGASQATNDTLRKGGKLEVIVSNLKRAVEIRRETGADLRMGVSTVVTLGNYTELPALGRQVVDLGLDWLKVEEIFPCTKSARALMIPGRDPRIEEMMGALHRTISKSGLVVVDHRDPPSGCACEGRSNALLAEFRKADNFANRADLKPCRMEWEQAAIDPDGTVHPVDYGRPAIGNLLTTSMAEIWNGPEIAELRKAALRRTSKSLRQQCPH